VISDLKRHRFLAKNGSVLTQKVTYKKSLSKTAEAFFMNE
jgi:hypothetical protein